MKPDPVLLRRRIRRLALQMLYQIEARGTDDAEDIRHSLQDASNDPEEVFGGAWKVIAPTDAKEHERAFERAMGAWEKRAEADRLATEFAPKWPTHRQPALDRSIIRLCWYEMTETNIPPKAAVNEAVELAKAFGTERSKTFLNGVLDRMLRIVLEQRDEDADGAVKKTEAQNDAPVEGEVNSGSSAGIE